MGREPGAVVVSVLAQALVVDVVQRLRVEDAASQHPERNSPTIVTFEFYSFHLKPGGKELKYPGSKLLL